MAKSSETASWLEPQSSSSRAQHQIELGSQPDPSSVEDTGGTSSTGSDGIIGSFSNQSLTQSVDPGFASGALADPLTGIAQAPSLGTTTLSTTTDKQLYIVFVDGPPTGNADALGLRIRSDLGIETPAAVFEHLNGFTAMLTADQAARLAKSRGVLSVEADSMVSLVQPMGNDAPQANRTSGGSISAIGPQQIPSNVSAVWGSQAATAQTANNSGKYVFVLDTGVSTTTGDLNINSTLSRNFTTSTSSAWQDGHGHGTHVSGTVAAVNDSDGVVGVAAGAQVIAVRVLNSQGSGMTSWIVNGINYAAGVAKTGALQGINLNDLVANMSLGGGINSSIDSAISAAASPNSAGRFLRFAVAAGNSSADADNYSPARMGHLANVYTVSAVTNYTNKSLASFSNWDNIGDSVDNVDYATPGVNVVSLGINGNFVTMSGTSMASPAMAGILLMGGPSQVNPLGYSVPYGSTAAPDPLAVLG